MKISYRQARSKSELASLFQLRHQVFSENQEINSIIQFDLTHDYNEFDPNHYDLTKFDINACHFGAFIKNMPIGYMRITSSTPTSSTQWTKEIILENGIEIKPNNDSFPFEQHYPDKDWSNRFLNTFSNKKNGEIGKLAIHGDFRNGGLVFQDLIYKIQELCIYELEYDFGITICTLELEDLYKSLGFIRIHNSLIFPYKKSPEAVIMQFPK